MPTTNIYWNKNINNSKIQMGEIMSIAVTAHNAEAQLTVTMSSVEVDQNAQATVDITVNGFTNLLGVVVVSYIGWLRKSASATGLASS